MLARYRIALGFFVLTLAVGVASTSDAANQLYKGSLIIESFGNDNANGTLESEFFEILGIPFGNFCNPGQPRCNDTETPVETYMNEAQTKYKFAPLGTLCKPISYFGVATRPAKGASPTSGNVHYRNPNFFTPGGNGKETLCTDSTTVLAPGCTVNATSQCGVTTMYIPPFDPQRGVGMKGKPLTGYDTVNLTGTGPAGFTMPTAGAFEQAFPSLPFGFGMRRTTLGSFNNYPPYVYSYTYVALRNDAGFLYKNGGIGDLSKPYPDMGNQKALVKVTAGENQFGGVMRMLGQLTVKVCYFRVGGCSLGENDWLYDEIGLTQTVLYSAKYYNTGIEQTSLVEVIGERFKWTTGNVTLTAVGRGPHKTVERRKGYDNRTDLGKGTIQLVSPVLTHWIQPGPKFETGGIAIMRLRFIPEPSKAMLLAAGLSVLAVLYRLRLR